MPTAQDLIERARMFEERAERACDPISPESTTERWPLTIDRCRSSIRK